MVKEQVILILNVYTVSFFGHRVIDNSLKAEKGLEKIIRELILTKEYVEFLVGRNGDFDILVASVVRRMKKAHRDDNSELTLVLPYLTAEYKNNRETLDGFYDRVEICRSSECAHFKSAMQIRNREMVDRSNLVVSYIEKSHGGAYQTVNYALKCGKEVINTAEDI